MSFEIIHLATRVHSGQGRRDFLGKSQEALRDGHFLNFAAVEIFAGGAYLRKDGLRRRRIMFAKGRRGRRHDGGGHRMLQMNRPKLIEEISQLWIVAFKDTAFALHETSEHSNNRQT